MIRLHGMSIHNRLTFALWCAALFAFAAAGVALALFENLTQEGRARQIMEPYAQLVSAGAETAIAFQDSVRAEEILTPLRANAQILTAEIVLRDGRMLARYSSAGTPLQAQPLKPDGIHLSHDTAELIQRLHDDAHLRLVMSLGELNRQMRNMLLLFAAGMLVLLVVVTLGLRAALQRVIVQPISALAETVEQVRIRADYHQRVPVFGNDEVARLGRSFNAMMEAVQVREDNLRQLAIFQSTILDNAAYGIIATTTEGVVSSFNRAAEQLLGYRADELVGRQTPICWHEAGELAQYALHLSTELSETVQPGFEVFTTRPRRNQPEEHEWTFIRKDGTRVPVLLSVTALRDENRQIIGFAGLCYDLTERKQAEEELRQLNEELEQRVWLRTAELAEKNDELQRMNKMFVGRELRMVELKERIRELEEQLRTNGNEA